ncbi:MAG: hypothetical protein AAF636_23305 [Pseudomonadota bacterium]
MLAESGHAQRHLIVFAIFVLKEIALTQVDEEELMARTCAAAVGLSPEIDGSEQSKDRLRPACDAIFERLCQTPIPEDVLPAKIHPSIVRHGTRSTRIPSLRPSPVPIQQVSRRRRI